MIYFYISESQWYTPMHRPCVCMSTIIIFATVRAWIYIMRIWWWKLRGLCVYVCSGYKNQNNLLLVIWQHESNHSDNQCDPRDCGHIRLSGSILVIHFGISSKSGGFVLYGSRLTKWSLTLLWWIFVFNFFLWKLYFSSQIAIHCKLI